MVWLIRAIAPKSSSSKAGERRNIQRPAVDQRGERGVKCVGRGRTAGQKDVHLHKFVNGPHDAQQLGHHDAGNLRCALAFSM